MKGNKSNSKISAYVKYGAGIIAVLLIVFAVKSFIGGSSAQPIDNAPQNSPKKTYGSDAQMQDGVQVARLSWGKFNYDPQVIHLKKDIPTRIEGDMNRLQGCFRSIRIPDLDVSEAMNEANPAIEFIPSKAGTFNFGCAMGMGQGQIIVE